MILDLDVGNTRIKWRIGGVGGGLLRSADWRQAIVVACERPGRIRVANVAGKDAADDISRWAAVNWGVTPEFAVTTDRAAGVRCGYSCPNRLGVDRWLAIVAAFSRYPQNLVVVNAGSAITVDLVRSDGQHLGGYIVPGLEMQRRALYSGTSDVKVKSGNAALTPGTDTESAVRNGSLVMTVALIENSLKDVGDNALVVVAGGDAERLVPHLVFPSVAESELVLDGLAVLLP